MADHPRFHAAVAMFDEASRARIVQIQQTLVKQGFVSARHTAALPPHITLGAYEGLSDEALCEWARAFCRDERTLPVLISHYGAFSDQVLFLAPRVGRSLLNFHARWHIQYAEDCGEVGYLYAPQSGAWVPHVTLMHGDPEENRSAAPLLLAPFEPFEAELRGIAIYKFYPAQLIEEFPLTT